MLKIFKNPWRARYNIDFPTFDSFIILSTFKYAIFSLAVTAKLYKIVFQIRKSSKIVLIVYKALKKPQKKFGEGYIFCSETKWIFVCPMIFWNFAPTFLKGLSSKDFVFDKIFCFVDFFQTNDFFHYSS